MSTLEKQRIKLLLQHQKNRYRYQVLRRCWKLYYVKVLTPYSDIREGQLCQFMMHYTIIMIV